MVAETPVKGLKSARSQRRDVHTFRVTWQMHPLTAVTARIAGRATVHRAVGPLEALGFDYVLDRTPELLDAFVHLRFCDEQGGHKAQGIGARRVHE